MNTTSYHPFVSQEAKETYSAFYDQSASRWPLPSESLMIPTPYGQTFVRVSGPADAPPLVLLHGAGSTSLSWLFSIEALSKDHRTYTVDSLINTGCVGRSIYTRPISNASEASEWIDALFDNLGLGENISLLGASYGGWIVSQYLLRHAERIHKSVWIAPAGTVLPFGEEYLRRSLELYINPSIDTFENFFRWSLNDFLTKYPEALQPIVDEFTLTMQSFVPPNPDEVPQLNALSDDDLRSITRPTLFLIGENDVLYSASDALERLHAIAPQIETSLIHGAGHDVLLVKTDIVNQKILEFLKD
ncbi:MAG: alpha/beta hydrolase [Chloroflexota bacterium]